MDQNEISLSLSVLEDGADEEQIDNITITLVQNLYDLGVKSVRHTYKDSAEFGARGDPITLGTIALLVTPVVLDQILDFFKTIWLNKRRKAKIEIDISPSIKVTLELTKDSDWDEIKSVLDDIYSKLGLQNNKTN